MKAVRLSEVSIINPRAEDISPSTAVSFVGMAQLDARSATAVPLETREFAEVSKGYTVFRNGDILAAKITPCWENGKVGQASLDHTIGVGSTEFHVVRPRDSLDSRYLLHLLRHPHLRASGELRMTGSGGQRRVPAEFLKQLELPLPPLPEQRRIAAVLDHADAIRAKRRQVLAHLDSLPQAIFHSMFGHPRTWIGRHPMTRIGDLASSVAYGTSAKAGATGEWPILRMGNVTDDGRLDLTDLKYIDLAPRDTHKYTVRTGDLLFNRTNSREKVGKAAVVRTKTPLALAGYLVRVRFDDVALAEFVAAYLNSPHGRAVRRRMAKAAVNQANISAREMCAISIARPDPDTVTDFADCLNHVDRQRAAYQGALAVDDELFASLQSRAFRGEL